MSEPIQICGFTVQPHRESEDWRIRIGGIDVRIWRDPVLPMFAYHVGDFRALNTSFSSEVLTLEQMIERVETLVRGALDTEREALANQKSLLEDERSWYWRSHPSRHDFKPLTGYPGTLKCTKCGGTLHADMIHSKYAGPLRFNCKGATQP